VKSKHIAKNTLASKDSYIPVYSKISGLIGVLMEDLNVAGMVKGFPSSPNRDNVPSGTAFRVLSVEDVVFTHCNN
jgi:hypothetical protein